MLSTTRLTLLGTTSRSATATASAPTRSSPLASQVLARRTLFTSKKPKPPGWKPFYKRRPILFTAIASPVVITASLGLSLLALFAYDASTYQHKHLNRVNVSEMAVEPERGGKKGLKVAKALVDDEDERTAASKGKKRLVIVGGGWGVSASAVMAGSLSRFVVELGDRADLCASLQSVGILKHLDPNEWHVTVVAPDNYFLFQ